MKDLNNILANYFSGEASSEEKLFIAAWKGENKEEYDLLSQAFKEQIELGQSSIHFDEIAAWDKVHAQLKPAHPRKIIPIKRLKKLMQLPRYYSLEYSPFYSLKTHKL